MPVSRPRIFRPTEANVTRLANALRRGAIVGVPSETVYGLAADALNAAACAKIFEAKGRPSTDPLIVHLADAGDVEGVAVSNPGAMRLARQFWPGPLTLVLPKRAVVSDLVTAGNATVAVRVPAHPVFQELIRRTGRPLAAPSANRFGYISPTTAFHVRDGLVGTTLRAVIDGGECAIGVESTIIDLTDPDSPRLLRPGGLALEELEKAMGCAIPRPRRVRLGPAEAAPAPGMLSKHYSPRTPLFLHERLSSKVTLNIPGNEAVVYLRRPSGSAAPWVPGARVFWLSEGGDAAEIAHQLFGLLRKLDLGEWRALHVELPHGGEGLVPAIRDRLFRAAAKR